MLLLYGMVGSFVSTIPISIQDLRDPLLESLKPRSIYIKSLLWKLSDFYWQFNDTHSYVYNSYVFSLGIHSQVHSVKVLEASVHLYFKKAVSGSCRDFHWQLHDSYGYVYNSNLYFFFFFPFIYLLFLLYLLLFFFLIFLNLSSTSFSLSLSSLSSLLSFSYYSSPSSSSCEY